MVFKTKYTEEQVLAVMSKEKPMNAPAIAKAVGCSVFTAKKILDRLEAAGKAKSVEYDTGGEFKTKVWLRTV
jgi:predicted ArsR family transcriptional regulator